MANNEPLPDPRANVEPQDYVQKMRGRHVETKFIDPCQDAAKASLDCMEQNDYQKSKCLEYFYAYKECKGIWLNKRREDRRAGRPTS